MLDIDKLILEFKENSKGEKTVSKIKIDSKHKRIIKQSEKNIKQLSYKNFRNWDSQNDMGLKFPMTFISKIFLGLKSNFLLSFLIKILKKRLNHIFEYSSMVDDIEVILKNDGEYLLKENPQNLTPGAINFPLVQGYSVTTRWLRYLYILSQIKKFKLLDNSSIWLDVGSYYGGLQGLVKKYFPNTTLILVDFNHQLLRSFIYLKNLYPESNHILPDKIKSIKSISDCKGSILYVNANDFHLIENFKVDLVSNFFSLGEMKKETFKTYTESGIFKNSKNIYYSNRIFSSPYFDKTYDDSLNIFDYKNSNFLMKYFDVFPVGNFNISNRLVFNRYFFRNFASQYFEMILINKKKND